MFSGKTTRLLARLQSAPAGCALAIRHYRDKRYSLCEVRTHCGTGFPAETVSRASEIPGKIRPNVAIVGIDEGHFYDMTLVEVCRDLVGGGRRVVVTALDTDMWGRPFPVIEALRQAADVVCVTQATCARCSGPACRTQRTTPLLGKCLVGGPEAFEPRCASCWRPPPEPPVAPEEAQ
jgi:thymidine kinase